MSDLNADEVFASVARNVAYRNRGVVEADDIKQELWVWWLSNGRPSLTDPDWALTRTLYTVAERYCKVEREARMGPSDNYSEAEVMVLVELLVNPETSDTAALAGELSEVLTVLSELDESLRKPLVLRASGQSYRDIAERLGLSPATAHRRVQQAIYTIASHLNGES